MQKRLISFIITVVFLLTLVPTTIFAAGEVNITTITNKKPGEFVTIAGTSGDDRVAIKVIRPDTTIYDIGSAGVAGGAYNYHFTLPLNASVGTYTVVVGQGTNVATTTFNVVPFSSQKDILSFSINEIAGVIADTSIILELPKGTDVSSLVPRIKIPEGASIDPGSGVARNFASPVNYTVTAEDGSAKSYTVTVMVETEPEKPVKEVKVNAISGKKPGENVTVTGTTEYDRVTIKLIKPDTTIYDIGSAGVAGGAYSYNLTLHMNAPVGTYTVVVGRGTAVATTTFNVVPFSSQKNILSFSINEIAGVIADTSIMLELPKGTDVSSLVPSIEISEGASIDPGSGVARNFSTPVSYTVTAEDGSTKTYTVTVTVESDPEEPVKEVKVVAISEKKPGEKVAVTGTTEYDRVTIKVIKPDTTLYDIGSAGVIGGAYSYHFTLPMNAPVGTYTVVVGHGTVVATTTFKVVAVALSSGKDILSFSINDVAGTITGTNIKLELPKETNVSSLVPSIAISEKATISPKAGTAVNFANPVVYTVTAEDGSTKRYTVTVTVATDPGNGDPGSGNAGSGESSQAGNLDLSTKVQISKAIDGTLINVIPQSIVGDVEKNLKVKGVITLKIGTGEKSKSLNLPADLLAVAADKEGTLNLDYGNAKLSIPGNVVDVTELAKKLGEKDTSKITVNIKVKEIATPDIAEAKLKGTDKAFEFIFEASTKDGKMIQVSRFDHPLILEIPVEGIENDEVIEGIRNVYKVDVNPPKYCYTYKAGSNYIVELNGFSKYAVLEYDGAFDDVEEQNWAHNFIQVLSAKEIVAGVGENKFAPGRNVTRAEFVTMVVKALNIKTTGYKSLFKDVSSNAWYSSYVEAACTAGIVSGVGNGSFDPNGKITREQMTTIVMKAYSLVTGQKLAELVADYDGSLKDLNKSSKWANESIKAAHAINLISGMTVEEFMPLNLSQRDHAATVIVKLLGSIDRL